MKLGYPSINWTIGCKGDKTFHIKSYSRQRLIETADNNLKCLYKVLKFNLKHNLLFFRITSKLIPFASHPLMDFDWKEYFRKDYEKIGEFIKENQMRISMHPGQFTFINSKNPKVFKRALKELEYHRDILDLLKLDNSAKIQIHVGGVYEDKERSIERFIKRYEVLDDRLKKRLTIENDEKNYNLFDCLKISLKTKIPVVFDYFHHEINNTGYNLTKCFESIVKTWKIEDGIPIVDYSSQAAGKTKGAHAKSIDIVHFKNFLKNTEGFDFDIMLEIKDKEKSALKALNILKKCENL